VLVTRKYVEYYHIRISTARSFLVTEEKENHLIDINLCSSLTYYAKIDTCNLL
jgi:hypothetical protein